MKMHIYINVHLSLSILQTHIAGAGCRGPAPDMARVHGGFTTNAWQCYCLENVDDRSNLEEMMGYSRYSGIISTIMMANLRGSMMNVVIQS